MKFSLVPLLRLVLVPLLLASLAGVARAQYELIGTQGNLLFLDGIPTSPVNPPILPQFAGANAASGNSSAANAASLATPIPNFLIDRYPAARFRDSGGALTGQGFVLERSRFGNVFASGVPRYFLGDIITAPSTQADRVAVADSLYWRGEPVRPGETFVHPEGEQDASPPVPADTVPTFYYSPHAERVFASQGGRVTITWVTRQPETTPDDPRPRYRYREEIFSVSSATQKPVRPIYWTERGFSSPSVSIPTGSIETVNPIYNVNFPATVAAEYKQVGTVSNPSENANLPEERRTLWFEKTAGIGSLHAYNIEGRVLVEYLGPLKPGSTNSHVFLGADIVEVTRLAPSVNVTVELGRQLTPRDASARLLPLDGGEELLASPVLRTNVGSVQYYGTSIRADGRTIYYAERENDNPDRVSFYWLQRSDASIHFLAEPATPNLNIHWPLLRNNYAQIWPESATGFEAHYTVYTGGSTATTSLAFSGDQLPQLIFQDDGHQAEAVIDLATQRLLVALSADGYNRSLLKFTSGSEVWYLRLYTQDDERSGYQEGDGAASVTGTAYVGQRIEPPAGYSLAGYIASGTGYNPLAYKDPFRVGATVAETGAIIPVNARPGDDLLKIWWFKKISPPSPAFSPIYVPAKVGRYTLAYPPNPPLIVLASNQGSGDLPAAAINSGSLYIQNDPALPGYNPNEEHALLLAGRIYALRDDLNVLSADAAYTSEPFALMGYTHPTDKRPAMLAFKVLRELDLPGTADDILFDYPVTAGTILQGPMPLPLLPLPALSSGEVANTEVLEYPDDDHLGPTPYDKFTFRDRKGYDWVYRGPHYESGSSPRAPLPTSGFDTDGDAGLWTVTDQLGSVTVADGTFSAVADGNGDAYVAAPDLSFSSNDVPFIAVRMRSTAPWQVYLHWVTTSPDEDYYHGTRRLELSYDTPGQWRTLVFDMRSHPGWAERTITGLRIDPVDTVGGVVEFDWIGVPRPYLGMRLYYSMREGFHIPGLAEQPAAGTVLPYLRPLQDGVPLGHPVTGTSLTIRYHPVWPDDSPELRVGESLALPKFGLPDIYSQTSAQILYQQSIAHEGDTKPSAILHDPIREKTFALGAAGALQEIPPSVLTNRSGGKVYFQNLAPHLQERFHFDPARGTKGALVLTGEFVNEAAGEDYLQLNVLSLADREALRALVPSTDATNVPLWNAAIDGLSTTVETFEPNPAKPGTFRVKSSTQVSGSALAEISSSDTAVAKYALTASGKAAGWISVVMGDGEAFTDGGDPVSVQVFRVAPRLYDGEMKVILSGNPLDEQVTLRHSGDFAALTDRYEFEWRYTPPADGVAPPTYLYSEPLPRLGETWKLVQNPGAPLPPASAYNSASSVALPRIVQIKDGGYTGSGLLPGIVLRSESALDFSTGVPAEVIFSADLGEFDGLVVYINGVAALASDAPSTLPSTAARTGLVATGLSRQFVIAGSYFTAGPNRVEVALYSDAIVGNSSTVNLQLHASTETDKVVELGTPWIAPDGELTDNATVGGSPTAPLGGPLLVMSDNYFTMRYRPRDTSGVTGATWSRWTPPKLVEGWIKRVLAAINPFNQRVSDLSESAVNTDVSLLTQAGARWEGNIALNLDNINDFGLIEIYETVLNRAKNISIDSGYDYGPANDALLLAAGYLNDLYTILGNEAFADAANPTISIDDNSSATEINTSRFSFEGQVSTVLSEELALLRGRDDFLNPAVTVAPAYNRLYWNYTRGINSGEALYAVNYNIREIAGSPTANGTLDAADAQRMFPQGHGDAYGHYLTALTGYYQLLQSPHFTWVPRSEAVTVLGQAVQIDYADERKFAAAAANVARTATQILALTRRRDYVDDPSAGWAHLRDGAVNSRTGVARHWGLDEWTSRSTQGAYYNWVVGNALLPDVDDNPAHTGIQVIDRGTVPDLVELASAGTQFQTVIDGANSRLNPLGLSPGAIAFDISPADLKAGRSHYEQIYDRALRAVLNAKGAFDQAAKMTRSLRNQETDLDTLQYTIDDQEGGFTDQLIEIFGTPYVGDIGPGKTYAQGYEEADFVHWFIVDRPTTFVDTTKAVQISVRQPLEIPAFTGFTSTSIKSAYDSKTQLVTVKIQPDQFLQFSDTWTGGVAALGSRRVTGALQQTLLDLYQAQLDFRAGADAYADTEQTFLRLNSLLLAAIDTQTKISAEGGQSDAEFLRLAKVQRDLTIAGTTLVLAGDTIRNLSGAAVDYFPKVVGLSNDGTSGARGTVATAMILAAEVLNIAGNAQLMAADAKEVNILEEEQRLAGALEELGFNLENRQAAFELEQAYRELLAARHEIAGLSLALQRSAEAVRTTLAAGEKLLDDRETFRQRAAAIIQGYRTKDLTFRTFRNEALEQYRSLFDLASRYTYLAAQSYDYETGLLGSESGAGVLKAIVASRALGDLTGGQPQATVSTLGDAGLAGTMARLQADWAVAEGRLGINNPDQNGTLFSLRRELFRLLDDPERADDDAAWQQVLEQHIVPDLLADPDAAAFCNNLRKPAGGAVPGFVIPFRTTIEHGLNFFGLPLAGGDHAYSPSNYSTKIYASGLVLRGYVGMDPYAFGTPNAGTPNGTATNALGATPYVYLIPVGTDYQLAPAFGDTGGVRAWQVRDQALPLPFNLGATAFSETQFFNANGTLNEQPWILRKHPAFRPVDDPAYFYSSLPQEFTNSRLVGRSAWNGRWKLVIPAYTLLANEQDGLNRFVASVKDIELFLRTYSHSGN